MTRRTGFTLVELLVVLGIIAVLAALSASSIVNARRKANAILCAAQLGNVAKALIAYGNDQGAFPPNSAMESIWWTDEAILGPYAGYSFNAATGASLKGLVCPEDDESVRSYSMNLWASSFVDSYMKEMLSPTYGVFWKPTSTPSAQLLLAVEAYSAYSAGPGWAYAPEFVGEYGNTAGQRFGALGGIAPVMLHNGLMANTQLEWRHHGSREPRINLAFADGHVKSFTRAELVYADGTLTGEAYWCPADR